MKFVKQSAELVKTHGYTIQDIYKDIERAARVSYRSEDKITEDSAQKMVRRLIEWGHHSPLEFGTVYLTIPSLDKAGFYMRNKFSSTLFDANEEIAYVTTNYRVIVENNRQDDLQYLTAPTLHIRRYTVKFLTSRNVTHELVRHRSMSFMQESQRYVGYDKDKFGGQVEFIEPLEDQQEYYDTLKESYEKAESSYMKLRESGASAQVARGVLPNCTATRLYMCGTDRQWEQVFALRDKPTVDPQMYQIMHDLHNTYNK